MAIRVYQVLVQALYLDPGTLVSSSLNLQESATYFKFVGGILFPEDDLNLQETLHVFPFEFLDDELNLDHDVVVRGPIYIPALVFPVNIEDEATYTFGLRWEPYEVTDDLALTHAFGFTYDHNLVSTIAFDQDAYTSHVETSDLSLVDTVVIGRGYSAEQSLDLLSVAERDAILNQTVAHNLGAGHAVTYFIESPCATKRRADFHGEGGVIPQQVSHSYASSFTLSSVIDSGDFVQLRNPESDDRQRVAFQRVNRSYLDGTADIYSDPSWPVQEEQLYTVVATKRVVLSQLQTFLSAHLGMLVYIKDWKGVTWEGVITNPGEAATEDGEGYWTLIFEVTASKLGSEPVVTNLSLVSEATYVKV